MMSVRTRVTLLTGAALAALGASPAFAQASGTASGTTITNQATVSYTIGGAAATPVTSNTATFLVDKKVNLTVTAVGTPTYVSVGSNNQVATFTVTNNTNSVQDFKLEGANTGVALGGLLGTGDFLPTVVGAYADTNGSGVFDAGDLPYIDELAADATIKVFVVANIPTGTIHTGNVQLLVTAEAGGATGTQGAVLTATSPLVADTPGAVDIVFADGGSLLTPTTDLARDGKVIAFNQFQIDNAAITVAKTSVVVSDPVNGIVFPKAIPGATMRYCITVSNAGPGTATAVTVNDAIPANTTYVPNSIVSGLTACTLGTGTAGTFDAQGVHAVIGTVLPNVPIPASFLVTIN